ncbi:GPP34 family phosphoprotein, partial [Mycobacterium tuberculosis]
MARIAEDLFLLLLDNASAQPGLDRRRRERVLGAAVLLDLAYMCRVRPALAGE